MSVRTSTYLTKSLFTHKSMQLHTQPSLPHNQVPESQAIVHQGVVECRKVDKGSSLLLHTRPDCTHEFLTEI